MRLRLRRSGLIGHPACWKSYYSSGPQLQPAWLFDLTRRQEVIRASSPCLSSPRPFLRSPHQLWFLLLFSSSSPLFHRISYIYIQGFHVSRCPVSVPCSRTVYWLLVHRGCQFSVTGIWGWKKGWKKTNITFALYFATLHNFAHSCLRLYRNIWCVQCFFAANAVILRCFYVFWWFKK